MPKSGCKLSTSSTIACGYGFECTANEQVYMFGDERSLLKALMLHKKVCKSCSGKKHKALPETNDKAFIKELILNVKLDGLHFSR